MPKQQYCAFCTRRRTLYCKHTEQDPWLACEDYLQDGEAKVLEQNGALTPNGTAFVSDLYRKAGSRRNATSHFQTGAWPDGTSGFGRLARLERKPMSVDLMTDRALIAALLEASDRMVDEELKMFASMQHRLLQDDGMSLTPLQRHRASEVFNRLRLKAPSPRKRTLGKAGAGINKRKEPPPTKRWWDGHDPSFHPLKPPPGSKSWYR